MKKLFIATLVLIGFSGASFAQTAPAAKNESAKVQAETKPVHKKNHSKVAADKTASPATAATTTKKNSKQLKKDGAVKKDGIAHAKKSGKPVVKHKDKKAS